MDLTKEYFDKWLGLLVTKDDLNELDTKLNDIKHVQNSHTNALDAVVKQTKDWNAEMTVMRQKMEKYESALKLMAEKTQVNISSLLN